MSFTQADLYLTKDVIRQLLDWRTASFSLALMIYGLTGSPTPDAFGLSETLTALLLLASIRVPVIATLPPAAFLFAVYGLTLPLLIGVGSGATPATILRDLIPFGFLLLPFFFQGGRHLPLVIGFVGLSFAVRTLLPYRDALTHPEDWLGQPPADLLYLANSPEVLFSALLLLGTGGIALWSGVRRGQGLFLILVGLIPVLAMAVMMQRAGLGCVILAGVVWSMIGLCLRPAGMLPLLALALCLLLPLYPLLSDLSHTLVLKTELVGLNSRGQEWGQVFELVGQSPWTWLFGLGWGATFENPAVGNVTVNYTHSLLSALLLKTGVIGLLLGLSYLWIFAKQAVPELLRRPVLMIALAAPLGIGVLFYASYKSLGFGLLLLLLANFALHRKLEKNQ